MLRKRVAKLGGDAHALPRLRHDADRRKSAVKGEASVRQAGSGRKVEGVFPDPGDGDLMSITSSG